MFRCIFCPIVPTPIVQSPVAKSPSARWLPIFAGWFLGGLMSASLTPCLAEDGFDEIFNGKDLTGWKGNPDLWSVRDGAITGITTKESPISHNTFLIWEGSVADFELELEYRVLPGDETNPGGNSGIQYRSRVFDEAKFIVGGYQADIDLDLTYSGINYEERGRGILAQRGQRVTIAQDGSKEVETFGDSAELGSKIAKGQWNRYRIVCKGNRLSHLINDQLMSETIDQQSEKSSSSGVLAFQIHTGPPMMVQFRNVRLKVER
jgi:hypothetical protein